MLSKINLIIALLVISCAVNAQSVFAPLPKPKTNVARITAGQAAEPTQNAFRPVANIGSYLIGSAENALLTGAGISYQHLQYNSATQKWSAVWSINALAWGKVGINGTPDSKTFLYGLAGGFLNNLIMVGAATDGKKIFATAGFGINFNN